MPSFEGQGIKDVRVAFLFLRIMTKLKPSDSLLKLLETLARLCTMAGKKVLIICKYVLEDWQRKQTYLIHSSVMQPHLTRPSSIFIFFFSS